LEIKFVYFYLTDLFYVFVKGKASIQNVTGMTTRIYLNPSFPEALKFKEGLAAMVITFHNLCNLFFMFSGRT